MAPRLSREMLKALFEGKKQASSGDSEGDVTFLAVDLASCAIAPVLLTASGVVSAFPSEGLAIDEGRLSIWKRLRDAGGVEPSASVPSVGVFNPPTSGDRRVVYRQVEDQALGVLSECHALEFRFQIKMVALK